MGGSLSSGGSPAPVPHTFAASLRNSESSGVPGVWLPPKAKEPKEPQPAASLTAAASSDAADPAAHGPIVRGARAARTHVKSTPVQAGYIPGYVKQDPYES